MRKLVALVVVTGGLLLPALPAVASTTTATRSTATVTPDALHAAASWLAAQVDPGGFVPSSVTPGAADLSLTAQAVLALASSGVGGTQVDAMEAYLAAHVDDYVVVGGADQPARLAFLILDAAATGRSATSFGGADLVARLLATQQPSGLFGAADATYDGAYRQALSVLALDAVGTASPTGTAWLVDQQCTDGGWTAFRADTTVACPAVDPLSFTGPDTNSTALAAEALHAAGVTPTHDPVTWLQSVRAADGGFPYLGDATMASDANSTGLVVQALAALTGTPDTAGATALAGFQAGCAADPADRGGVAYQPAPGGDLVPDVFATEQAILGFAGLGLPLAAQSLLPGVPEVCAAAVTTTTAPATTSTTTAPVTTVGAPVTTAAPADPAAVDTLPATGSRHAGPLTALSAALLLAGAALVSLARRRTRSAGA